MQRDHHSPFLAQRRTSSGPVVFTELSGQRRSSKLFTGFTLVELLVVIALVGLLASLLVPTLARAKQSAQLTGCKSNLRQQGVALQMHVFDNQAFPMSVAPGEIPELESPQWARDLWHRNYWFVQLNAQMHSGGPHTADALFDAKYVFRCPSDPRRKMPWPDWHDPSFGYNLWGLLDFNSVSTEKRLDLGLGGRLNSASLTYQATPETDVTVPSDMIAIADGFEGSVHGSLTATFDHIARDMPYPAAPPGQREAGTEYARRRHNGVLNALFCDGHVTGPKLSQLFFDRNDAALLRWNKDHEPHRERLP